LSGDVWLDPAKSGAVGAWFGPGYYRTSWSIEVHRGKLFTDDTMTLVGHRHGE